MYDATSVIVVDNSRAIFIHEGKSILFMKVLLLRFAGCVEHWLLAVAADAYSVSFMGSKAEGSGVVLRCRQLWGPCYGWHDSYSDAIVPERDIIFAPLEAGVELVCRRHYFVKVPDDMITLDLGYTYNLCNETRIEEEGLPSSNGMSADQRVLVGDWISADCSSELSRALGLDFR